MANNKDGAAAVSVGTARKKSVYFIGIGGIGMSGAARLALESGWQVSGTDLVDSDLVRALRADGAVVEVREADSARVAAGVDVVVYSNAIAAEHVELAAARARGMKTQTYYQFLGELFAEAGKKQLVVTGMHGKSTTTAMLAQVLSAAERDPSVFVGTKIALLDGKNARLGGGEFVAIEGDEYMKGFLGYRPFGVIINNIEEEHLDVYRDLDDIMAAFGALVDSLPAQGGVLVYNGEDANAARIAERVPGRTISVGLEEGFDVFASRVAFAGGVARVTVSARNHEVLGGVEELGVIELHVPGRHNVLNALGVVALARFLGVPFAAITRGLGEFRGTWRRLELLGEAGGVTFYDDYGHHPTEIKATLEALRALYPDPERRIVLALELHQYERVQSLYDKFVAVLRELQAREVVQVLILTDFYFVEGRDDASLRATVNAARLVRDVGGAALYASREELLSCVKMRLRPGDILLTQGAGTITSVGRELMKSL